MARPNVPKFGDWSNNDNVLYTVCFDNARKNRVGGKIINPNDPQENPEMFQSIDPSPPPAPRPLRPRSRPRPEELVRKEVVRPTPKPKLVHEDFDRSQFGNSSSRNDNALNNGGRGPKIGPRSGRVNMGPNQKFEPSPLHPHFEPKDMRKRIESPVWNGINNDNIYVVPEKSQLNASTHKRYDKPRTGAAIPIFRDWDKNPELAENYTEAFNNWRDNNRNVEPINHLDTANQPFDTTRINLSNQPKQCCIIL